MTIAKLFARIGLKADQGKLDKFNKGLGGAKIGLAKMAVGAGIVSAALKKITSEAMKTALAFKNFEAETGASLENLQKWQQVADQANNSGKALTASIKSLVSNQANIELGKGNISGYQLIGIDPRQDPFKILEDLRVKLRGFSQARKKSILDQMGISSDLLQVLDLTNDEFDRMSANTFILPQSAIEQLDKARESSKLVGNTLKWLKDTIGAELAPMITKMNKKIVDWIKLNKDGIVKTVKDIFTWIGKASTAIGRAVKMIEKIIVASGGWKAALVGIAAVMAIINAPLLIMIGLIAFLVLVLEDLYVFSQGGNSLFGKLLGDNPKLQGFVDLMKDLGRMFSTLFTGDTEGFRNLMEEWGAWGTAINVVLDALKLIEGALINLFTGKGWQDAWDEFKESPTGEFLGLGRTHTGADEMERIANEDDPLSGSGVSYLSDPSKSAGGPTYNFNTDMKVDITGMTQEEATEAIKNAVQGSYNRASASIGGTY